MTASELFAQRNSREVTGMAKKLSKGRGVGGDRLEICPPRTSSIRLRNSLEVELRIGRPADNAATPQAQRFLWVSFIAPVAGAAGAPPATRLADLRRRPECS